MPLSLYLGALAMGLLGSTHCLAMCGGVAAVLSGGIAPNLRRRPPAHIAYVVLYNVGRIASYSLLGAALGFLALGLRHEVARAQVVLRLVAGVLTLGLGLHLAGLLPAFARLERVGAPVWNRLAPTAARLLPVRSPAQAVLLGALWGFLPCGMVYTAVALAAAADGPLQAAATMTAFGVGTLPAMVGVGTVAGQALASMGRIWARRAAGIALAVLAVAALASASSALRMHDPTQAVCSGHLHD